MPQQIRLDEIDSIIVQRLRRNGRTPFKEIAQELNVSEGTIRNRLNRMIKRGVLRIVAITDPFTLGYEIDCIIGLQVDQNKLEEVSAQLTEIDELRFVGIGSGRYDIIIAGTFMSQKHLLEFLTHVMRQIEGVRRTETFHILQVQKRTYDWTPVYPPTQANRNAIISRPERLEIV